MFIATFWCSRVFVIAAWCNNHVKHASINRKAKFPVNIAGENSVLPKCPPLFILSNNFFGDRSINLTNLIFSSMNYATNSVLYLLVKFFGVSFVLLSFYFLDKNKFWTMLCRILMTNTTLEGRMAHGDILLRIHGIVLTCFCSSVIFNIAGILF